MNSNQEIIFTAHTLGLKGRTYPVEYSISPTQDKTVFAFTTMQDGEKCTKVRIKLVPGHDHYAQALKAAEQERAEREAAKAAAAEVHKPATIAPASEPIQSGHKTNAQAIIDEFLTGAEPTELVKAAPTKPATKPAAATKQQPNTSKPAKLYIGTEIKGKGWKISFDADYDRTRVIFKRVPNVQVREAVKAAGFYWSPVMKSWNKKLTNKAFMAAQGLAIELRKLCA